MTPERFRQIEAVFEVAADALSEERGAVLERLCGGDLALRAAVEALLAAAPDAAPWLRGAIDRVADTVARAAISPGRGTEGERPGVEGASLHRGGVIDGRFTIDRLAEMGGMGEVYRAIDGHSGGPVAIKVLRRDRTLDDRRFEREVRLLASVEHRHVVRHVTHGRLASGERYLAMEWLEGEGLDERLRRQRVTLGESVRLGRGLAEALGALHERGIVHRDLKPSNVFLVGGALSELRVLDLGIAWSRDWTSITQSGMFVGSLRYAAPEQALGARTFDARTDVFSLGTILFECLTGAPVFESEHPVAVLTRMALGEVPRLRHRARGVPEPLVELVDRMLSRDPRLRPFDGAEVARALRGLGELAETEAAAEVPAAEPATALAPPAGAITADEQSAVAILLLGAPAGEGADASAEALVREAERHGGQLSWLGDGAATVLVAGPTVATDLAARAARCALALRGVAGARPITLAVGLRESAERSALGPTIDRAARLLDEAGRVARPGAVTLDAATVGLLDGRFEVRRDDGGDLVLVGERGVANVRTLLGRPTPCVGRDRELRLLEELFEDCVHDGQAQAVLVTAPPGVGKTRLGAELLQRLHGRDAAVWTARASLMGAGSTLGMVVELVQAACGIAGGEPLDVQRRKLREAVTARCSSWEPPEQQRLTEFLGEIIAVRIPDDEASPRLRAARQDSSVMGDQVRAAFVDVLAAETAVRPVVLLLEDLHWADSATIRLIGAALRELAARPLYVIALARPEAQELFPERWTGRLQQLVLTPLSRRASEQLVRHVLGNEVSDQVLAPVVRLADGNAFFLEELIRATAEGRSATELPESAVAMVQSRLTGLDEPLRRALRAASVFGEIFWVGGVATLTGDGVRPGEADVLLQRLVELELVTPRRGSRFTGETELALRHALLREAAYGMLTPADRTLGHQLAGEWLERRGERDPLVLAEHFDRGGQGPRAAAYYLRAATTALGAGDSSLALRRARQGLAAGAVDEIRIELLGVLLEAKMWKLEPDTDDPGIADEVLACARPGSVAWEQAAFTKVVKSRLLPEAISFLDRVFATQPTPLAISSMVVCIVAGVWVLELCGLTRESDAVVQRAVEMMDGFAEAERFAFVWLQCCVACRTVYREPDPWRGLELIERSRDAAQALGFGRLTGFCDVWVEFRHACLGAVEEARDVSQRVTISDEELGAVSSIRPLGRAWLAFQRGELEEAIRQAERLLDLGRRRGLRIDQARSHWISAEVSRRSGNLAAAEAAAEVALALAMPIDRPAILATLAGARLAQGRTAEALAAAEEAMARYREIGFCSHFFGTALLWVVHTECLLAAEQHARARDAAADARAWLLGIADKIGDARYRATFLESVPEHRRILALAEG